MIFGHYSLNHLTSLYKDPDKRKQVTNNSVTVILLLLLWVTAAIFLVYYWNTLELWAKVAGIIGLLFNSGGPLITLLSIWLGRLPSDTEILVIPDTKQDVSVNIKYNKDMTLP